MRAGSSMAQSAGPLTRWLEVRVLPRSPGRRGSTVEQVFCKHSVGGSIPPGGSRAVKTKRVTYQASNLGKWVRVPLAAPGEHGPTGRASVCQSELSGFESRCSLQNDNDGARSIDGSATGCGPEMAGFKSPGAPQV